MSQTILPHTWVIPLKGNSFVTTTSPDNSAFISDGLHNWSCDNESCRIYFKVQTSGLVHAALLLKVPEGESRIKVVHKNTETIVTRSNSDYELVGCGNLNLSGPMYDFLEISPISKTGKWFADVTHVIFTADTTSFQKQTDILFHNDENGFKWGGRGPTNHLRFSIKPNTDWIYHELYVPKDNDPIGSYFCAIDSGLAYMGIQRTSSTKKRVIFSVWGITKTDNSKDVPASEKAFVKSIGDGVTSNSFQGEGTGQQSFYEFNWETECVYGFLMNVKPVDKHTEVAAWFYDGAKWKFLARIIRPIDTSYFKRALCFN